MIEKAKEAVMKLFGLKKREVTPKVYAFAITGDKKSWLSIRDGYSYEEEEAALLKEFKKDTGETGRITNYLSMDLQVLFDKYHEGKVALDNLEK